MSEDLAISVAKSIYEARIKELDVEVRRLKSLLEELDFFSTCSRCESNSQIVNKAGVDVAWVKVNDDRAKATRLKDES